MGLAVVLIFYTIILGGAAAVGSAVFVFVCWRLTRGRRGSKRTTVVAGILPFACFVWCGLWFLGYAVINDRVFHHDPGLGDGWYTNIGHGYAIDMIDITDQGIVHPTDGESNGLNNPAGLRGVRRLQVAKTWLLGTQDSHSFEHLGQESQAEDTFFAVDMATHQEKKFMSEQNLNEWAQSNGIVPNLQPIVRVYDQFRFTWFDYSAGGVLLIAPLLTLALLSRFVWKLHKSDRQESPPST